MRRSRRLQVWLVALAATFAANDPVPTQAFHAAAVVNPWAFTTDDGGVSFLLGASVGMIRGTASETVFDYPLGVKFKVSELTWDLKDVAVAGGQAAIGFGSRFRLNLGVWSAIDEGSGLMVDRDWMYPEQIAAVLIPADGNWTDESRHPDTSVDMAMLYDLNLTFTALHSGPFSLRAILGYKRDTWRWSARGGTYIYSYNNFRDAVGVFGSGQEVITYEQEYSIPYLGIGASWSSPAFVVDGHLLVSPLVKATDTDYHILRDVYFLGEFSGGKSAGLGGAATWFFAPQWFATFAVEYQSVFKITGDVTMIAPEGRYVFENGAAISLSAAMVTLGAGFRF